MTKGDQKLFDDSPYFFYITNITSKELSVEQIVGESNQRCDQENIIRQLKQMGALSSFSPTLRAWSAATPSNASTISGFLYLTVASLAVGMTVTAIRWACVDLVDATTGLTAPDLDFSPLPGKVDACNLLIEIHYRHYPFYSNMFVATAITWICLRISIQPACQITWIDPGFVLVDAIFFLTSRDTLRKYYQRTQPLLPPVRDSDRGEEFGVVNQKERQ